MSEERRKRHQERVGTVEAKPPSRTMLIWGAIVLLIAASYGGWWYYENHKYDNFAKCLTSKQAKMYGAYWCPHCTDQKAQFGRAFQYVNYVECAIKGSNEMTPACKAAGIKHYPTWQFGANPPVEGEFPMEELSDKTGCPLP
jgi:hypothetical protein